MLKLFVTVSSNYVYSALNGENGLTDFHIRRGVHLPSINSKRVND